MQAWTRQPTQCLFCAFRQSPRLRVQPARQIREWSSTVVRQRDTTQSERPKKKSRRRDDDGPRKEDDDKPRRRDKDLDLSSKPRRSMADGPIKARFPRQSRDPDEADEDLESSLRTAVTQLKRRLATKKLTEDHERTELQELDPTGTSWRAFYTKIVGLRRKVKGSGLQSSERALWNQLHVAKGKSKSHLDAELYFIFLDYTLESIDTHGVKEASGTPVDIRYPTEWYASARRAQRVIHLHVGPTNSGKTYNALKRLQESKNGFYAGPLRLLAHEVYSRFRANGIACDLITGDDIRLEEDAETQVYASTVEMVSVARPVDVAVIDEIQMMGSPDRGWAWTRAFLGANAKEVHLCGEQRVVPLIRELSASMGDTLKIHHYERLNPLRCMTRSLRGNLKLLRKGDCIVAFSIMQIHALKKQIELETGKRCAIVYGSLPPETRAEQAELFNDPDNDYDFLVASDAIGMGLNLSVKRIIFNSTTKYDGTRQAQLTIPQIKQIAGRAGRFRSAHQDKNKSAVVDQEENVGLVSSLDEADLPIIRAALQAEAPPMRKAGLVPPAEYLEEYASRLPAGVPFEYLMRRVSNTATLHPRFFLCDIRDKLQLARVTDDVPGLTIEQRVNITAAPATVREPRVAKCLKALAEAIASGNFVTVAEVNEIPLEILHDEPRPDRTYLESLEVLHKCLILYLWLSYRFPTNLRDQPMAIHAKGLTEQKINWTLRAFSANPKLRERLRKLRAKQTDLDPQQFAPDLQKAGGATNVTDANATVPAEADEGEEPALGGIQYTEEDEPVHIGEGEETIAEHFAEPVELENSETDDLVAANPEQEDVSPHVEGDNASRIVLDELAEPCSQDPSINAHAEVLDVAPDTHESTDRPADRASETVITPAEEEVLDEQLGGEQELRPDPADADAHVDPAAAAASEGEVPTAKGPKAEVIDLTSAQITQEKEVNQPRSASASG